MASIKRHHESGCEGSACDCPWRLDYRPLGMRGPRRRLEFKTKKHAERHLSETQHKVTRGEYVDPGNVSTFGEAAEQWFASKTDRRPSHVSDLRSRLDKHILPRIGRERLDRINVAALEKLRTDLRTDCYAPRTINTIVRIVGAVFKAAIRRGECALNPIERIERAFVATHELKAGVEQSDIEYEVNTGVILSPVEIRKLLDETPAGYYRTLLTTAFITGMRSGELLALRWSDVEFGEDGRGRVFVRRSLSWSRVDREEKVRARFYPPKTKAGLRTITIASELVAALKLWKLQCPPGELVFPHTDGQPNCRDRILRVGLYPALRRAGLRQVNFHSLRHSCASAMIVAGAPITEIQHRLGHASPAITLKVYSHFLKDTETDTADRLAEALLKKPAGNGSGQKVGTETGMTNVRQIVECAKINAA
jgi:integrase